MTKSKLDQIIDLMDSYIWVCRGSNPDDDDYSIRDEDGFNEFKEELEKLI